MTGQPLLQENNPFSGTTARFYEVLGPASGLFWDYFAFYALPCVELKNNPCYDYLNLLILLKMGFSTMKGDALTARWCCRVRRKKGDAEFYRIMENPAGQRPCL